MELFRLQQGENVVHGEDSYEMTVAIGDHQPEDSLAFLLGGQSSVPLFSLGDHMEDGDR
jgi:hypothetical protein